MQEKEKKSDLAKRLYQGGTDKQNVDDRSSIVSL